MAAVRGEAQAATPNLRRKRPAPGDDAQPEAGGAPVLDLAKEAIDIEGCTPGVTRVYEEGGLFQATPSEVKILIYGAHETLKRLTEKGGYRAGYTGIGAVRRKS